MRNNLCKSYSDCYSILQAWRVTVANLKIFLEIERLLEGCFCVNNDFSLQNLEMASPVGDALNASFNLYFSFCTFASFLEIFLRNKHIQKKKKLTKDLSFIHQEKMTFSWNPNSNQESNTTHAHFSNSSPVLTLHYFPEIPNRDSLLPRYGTHRTTLLHGLDPQTTYKMNLE